MLELWEGGPAFRESSLIYPSWFLGIFPRLLALFQCCRLGLLQDTRGRACMQSRLFGGCRMSEVERPLGQGSV